MHLQNLVKYLMGSWDRNWIPEEKPSKVDIFDFVEHCVKGDNVTDVVGDQVE